jgi:protein-disulfide isomerase
MGSKRLSIRDKRRQQLKRQRLVTILIVVLGALVVVGILIAPSISNALRPVGDVIAPPSAEIPNSDFNAMGDPNAPVTIIEYSDFQCPACKLFHDQAETAMINEYVSNGTVYFVYKPMGNWIGPESAQAAEAAYCAADQDRFWDFHATLFANQGTENSGNYSDRRLVAMAEAIGLDMDAFNNCLDSNKYRDQVNQDRAEGDAAGVQGTPSFSINGKLVGGAISFTQLQQEVEAALAASGQPTP